MIEIMKLSMLVSLFDAGKDTFVVIIILVAILMDFLPHILLKMITHDDGLENTRDDPIGINTDVSNKLVLLTIIDTSKWRDPPIV